ncbi:MAG: hypothetical protein ACRDT6_01625 [Micromonosporaceae bacterium]
MAQPTDPRVAYQRGVRHGAAQAYQNVLRELAEMERTIRREIAAVTLPTRKPPTTGDQR